MEGINLHTTEDAEGCKEDKLKHLLRLSEL